MNEINTPCPSCGSAKMSLFYTKENAPAHSVLLLPTRQRAVEYPTGSINLGFCPACGFISNLSFDSSLHEYSEQYEETQGFSPTFNKFHRKLAGHLVERYDLRGKEIIEIGCGKGDFLALLCEIGNNRGTGFDPAYVPGRLQTDADVTFIQDFYSEKYASYKGDFVCCKMTLEHILGTADFVGAVRRSVGDNQDTVIFFQVPNARYVFGDVAFWDIYYEHCSYFSLGSIARLFRHVGFDIIDLWTDYDDQYLMIEARPAAKPKRRQLPQEDDLALVTQDVAHFSTNVQQRIDRWREDIGAMRENGRRVVLWGGGSKGVAFLTTIGLDLSCIEYVVDINPHKAGTFMAGTGQEIVTPQFLQTYLPDVVIIMNPIYRDEIGRDLKQMGLAPELLTV